MNLDELQRRVAFHLQEATGAAIVTKLAPLAGGACQDNVRVEATIGGVPTTLVLRSDARRSLPGSLDRRAELAVIEAAVAAGVRTPHARHLGQGIVREGAWAYFLDWREGDAIGRKVVAHPSLEGARAKLVGELAQELAKVHTITPAKVTLPLPVPEVPARASLEQLRALTSGLPEPRPALELAIAWLEDHAPASREVTLVHGDFRTGNFLVTPAGLTAVLDWEFAHWGSPAEDLAWLCVRDWRFGRLDRAAGGVGSRAELDADYEKASGRRVDPAERHWWEVFGNARWAAGAALQGERVLSGGETDLELLALARRPGEMEFEALRLIEEKI